MSELADDGVQEANERDQVHKTAAVAYRAGKTVAAVAAELGITVHATRTLLHEANVRLRPQPGRWLTGEHRAQMRLLAAARYATVNSVPQIAAELGVSADIASRLLDEAGVARRPRGGALPAGMTFGQWEQLPAEAAARYVSGTSVSQIAADFGCHVGTVYGWLRQQGVPRRRNGPKTVKGMPADELAALTSDITGHYQTGKSIAQVADTVGYSYGIVRRILLRAEVTIRPGSSRAHGPEREAQRIVAAARYAKGDTVIGIAAALDCSTYLAGALLAEAGLEPGTRAAGRRS